MRLAAFFLGLFLASASAHAEPERARTHVVYSGQRLGSIAKRYGVTVDALCTANGLRTSDRIRPGQRLVIPARDDRDGTRARAETGPAPAELARPEPARPEPARAHTHRVEPGQRLESIARRHKTTVDALCAQNGIDAKSVLRPGQVLTLPGAPQKRAEKRATDSGYRSYFRAPKRKGYVEIIGYNETFRGHVLDNKDRLLPAAVAKISRILGTTGRRPKLEPRLLRLLVRLSDKFGGRPIRVVSGYRTTSYFQDSRHRTSQAVDFSVLGVPNDAVRDYLRTLPRVGVGYYPNSSFVHVDVREYAAYWVDYAGPGEAPRHRLADRRSAPDHADEPGDAPRAAAERANTAAALLSAAYAEAPPSRPAPAEPHRSPASD